MKKQLLIYMGIVLLFSVLTGCRKLNKKAEDLIPGHTWEITSIKLDGEEVLDRFYTDSCLCKKLYFSTSQTTDYPNAYSVYFSDCSNVIGEFSSIGTYSILESESVKPRKYAFMMFNNFSHSTHSCTCGRWGYTTYYTITEVDTKNNKWQMVADLPDGRWEIKLELSE